MLPSEALQSLLTASPPILALAPMQDVTDLPFWRVMLRYGGADLYYTEYFRVHSTSNLEGWILDSITKNPTGRPVVAQMIGNDIPSLVRTARLLQQHAVAAIDLNLGCPAPVVYRKCAGGGLLRDPDHVDRILGALREAVQVKFTVKTRLGFDDPSGFDRLLAIFAKHPIDLLTVHGRTVAEKYLSEVHYDLIARAVEQVGCPVLANGNITSASRAESVLKQTGAKGVMIGRAAIRNPWIFDQIRAQLAGRPLHLPTGRDMLGYLRTLFDELRPIGLKQVTHVHKMKKYLNFVGLGIEPTGQFLYRMRRVTTEVEFWKVCEDFLEHNDPMPLEPFALQLPSHDVMAGNCG